MPFDERTVFGWREFDCGAKFKEKNGLCRPTADSDSKLRSWVIGLRAQRIGGFGVGHIVLLVVSNGQVNIIWKVQKIRRIRAGQVTTCVGKLEVAEC